MRRDAGDASIGRILLEYLPHDLFGQGLALHLVASIHRAEFATVGQADCGSPAVDRQLYPAGYGTINTVNSQRMALPLTDLRSAIRCMTAWTNEVRLWLSVIAYNLGNLWRRLVLPNRIGNWSLTSLQQRLVKTGGRLVKHARYYWLLLAESHLTRRLFGAMVGRIAALPVPTG
jgi:Transposase DDE domain group 1